MKQIALWPILVFTLLSAAVSGAGVASAAEQDPPTGVGPVFIDSADILLLESFPKVVRGPVESLALARLAASRAGLMFRLAEFMVQPMRERHRRGRPR
jgi:hypothetical protein